QANLGSTSCRLAPTRPRGTAPARRTSWGIPGSAAPPSEPVVEPPRRSAEVTEKYLVFTLLGSLLDNPEKTEGLARLFRALYTLFDERRVSFAQGTIQLVLDAESAEKIADEAKALGLNVTVRDQ